LLSSQAVVDLAKDAGLGSRMSAAAVIDAARSGDPAATGIVDVVAARLAHLIASVSAVLDPELVLLGGGIGAGAAQLLIEPTARSSRRSGHAWQPHSSGRAPCSRARPPRVGG
jgi:predicted NBD/HSP70 family sugar kinase